MWAWIRDCGLVPEKKAPPKGNVSLPFPSYVPSMPARDSGVLMRIYRCSSLSISFSWIPNFYRERKTDYEITKSSICYPSQLLTFLGDLAYTPSRNSMNLWNQDFPHHSCPLETAFSPSPGQSMHAQWFLDKHQCIHGWYPSAFL